MNSKAINVMSSGSLSVGGLGSAGRRDWSKQINIDRKSVFEEVFKYTSKKLSKNRKVMLDSFSYRFAESLYGTIGAAYVKSIKKSFRNRPADRFSGELINRIKFVKLGYGQYGISVPKEVSSFDYPSKRTILIASRKSVNPKITRISNLKRWITQRYQGPKERRAGITVPVGGMLTIGAPKRVIQEASKDGKTHIKRAIQYAITRTRKKMNAERRRVAKAKQMRKKFVITGIRLESYEVANPIRSIQHNEVKQAFEDYSKYIGTEYIV